MKPGKKVPRWAFKHFFSLPSIGKQRKTGCKTLPFWDVVCIYNGILLSHKKEWNNAICSNMDEARDYHTKWSKSERQISFGISYMWHLKYDTHEPIYETEID